MIFYDAFIDEMSKIGLKFQRGPGKMSSFAKKRRRRMRWKKDQRIRRLTNKVEDRRAKAQSRLMSSDASFGDLRRTFERGLKLYRDMRHDSRRGWKRKGKTLKTTDPSAQKAYAAETRQAKGSIKNLRDLFKSHKRAGHRLNRLSEHARTVEEKKKLRESAKNLRNKVIGAGLFGGGVIGLGALVKARQKQKKEK